MVVFTHCGVGLGKTSVQNAIINLTVKNATKAAAAIASTSSTNMLSMAPQFLLNETPSDSSTPFSGLNKLNFICIGSTFDPYFQTAIDLYQQFLDVSGQKGELFVAHIEPESNKYTKNVYNGITFPTALQWQNEIMPHLIEEFCEINYKPFEAMLNCGEYHKLESPIIIWPTPMASFHFKLLIISNKLDKLTCNIFFNNLAIHGRSRWSKNDITNNCGVWLSKSGRYWIAHVT